MARDKLSPEEILAFRDHEPTRKGVRRILAEDSDAWLALADARILSLALALPEQPSEMQEWVLPGTAELTAYLRNELDQRSRRELEQVLRGNPPAFEMLVALRQVLQRDADANASLTDELPPASARSDLGTVFFRWRKGELILRHRSSESYEASISDLDILTDRTQALPRYSMLPNDSSGSSPKSARTARSRAGGLKGRLSGWIELGRDKTATVDLQELEDQLTEALHLVRELKHRLRGMGGRGVLEEFQEIDEGLPLREYAEFTQEAESFVLGLRTRLESLERAARALSRLLMTLTKATRGGDLYAALRNALFPDWAGLRKEAEQLPQRTPIDSEPSFLLRRLPADGLLEDVRSFAYLGGPSTAKLLTLSNHDVTIELSGADNAPGFLKLHVASPRYDYPHFPEVTVVHPGQGFEAAIGTDGNCRLALPENRVLVLVDLDRTLQFELCPEMD